MSETRRMLEAANVLSQGLRAGGIAHAFHGGVLVSVLTNASRADEIFCIVQGDSAHPFRLVRQAFANNQHITMTSSPWSNRLHAKYHGCIPPIEIEILTAGEDGPRRLDSMNVTIMHGIPWLSMSEFVRAKLKSWIIRGSERDAYDISFIITRYWKIVDINRIPEHDMDRFVETVPSAGAAWVALKRRYGM